MVMMMGMLMMTTMISGGIGDGDDDNDGMMPTFIDDQCWLW